MSEGKEIKVKVYCEELSPKEGKLSIKTWNKNEKVLRATKSFALYFVLALIALLIPVVHLILFPLFLIGAPLSAWMKYREESTLEGGEIPCPSCGAVNLPIDRKFILPIQQSCINCSHYLRVEAFPN